MGFTRRDFARSDSAGALVEPIGREGLHCVRAYGYRCNMAREAGYTQLRATRDIVRLMHIPDVPLRAADRRAESLGYTARWRFTLDHPQKGRMTFWEYTTDPVATLKEVAQQLIDSRRGLRRATPVRITGPVYLQKFRRDSLWELRLLAMAAGKRVAPPVRRTISFEKPP